MKKALSAIAALTLVGTVYGIRRRNKLNKDLRVLEAIANKYKRDGYYNHEQFKEAHAALSAVEQLITLYGYRSRRITELHEELSRIVYQ
jgi:hypothetical protein